MSYADISGLGGGAPQRTTPPPAPHFSTGGKAIHIDFAEANRALAHLDDAYQALDEAWHQGQPISKMQNPGNEDPSHGFVRNANPIGQSLLDEIHRQRQQVKSQYDNLKATLDQHRHTEAGNAANLSSQARS